MMNKKVEWQRLKVSWDRDGPACTLFRVRAFLAEWPDHPRAWIILGNTLTSIARYREARQALLKSIRSCPSARLDHPYVQMGFLYEEQGSYRIAERWFRKAIACNPKCTSNLVFLGACLTKQGHSTEAKRCFRRAIRVASHPLDEAYLNLGRALRTEERYKDALGCFRKALEIDPDLALAERAVRDLEKLERTTKQRRAWSRSGRRAVKGCTVRGEMTSEKAKWKKLSASWHRDEPACTASLARAFLAEWPDDALAWHVLGEALTSLARYQEARRALLKAIRCSPSRDLGYHYAMMGHHYMGDDNRDRRSYRIAERRYRKALSCDPKSTHKLIFLGACLAKQGRFAEAKRYHRRAIRLAGDTTDEAYLNLGFVLRAEERYDDALECFKKAFKIDPKYAPAKQAIRDLEKLKRITRSRTASSRGRAKP